MTLAVIVPFFEETEGLLARALASIAVQRGCPPPSVVVVDDGSPISAHAEVGRLGNAGASLSVSVMEQRHAGPVAARNRGLDSLGSEITRVAFLDADQTWTDGHLARANEALDGGSDCFVASPMRPAGDATPERTSAATAAPSRAIADHGFVYASAAEMFDRILRDDRFPISTVVYGFERFRPLRFEEVLSAVHAARLFAGALANAGARFAFSSELEVFEGARSDRCAAPGLDERKVACRIQDEMRYHKRLLGFDLSVAQRRTVKSAIAASRIEFASDFVRRIIEREPLPIDLLKAQFMVDPMTLFALPHHAGQLVAERVKRAHRVR